MESNSIVLLYQTNVWVLERQAEAISHAESLLTSPGFDNHMNWIVGHIIANRNRTLQVLGAEPVWQDDEGEVYNRGHDPVSAEEALPFDKLMADLRESQQRLEVALASVSAETLAEPKSDRTFGDRLLFAAWHEGYHTGQTEILRQLAGKNDKTI